MMVVMPVSVHSHFQRAFSLKPLGFKSQILYTASIGRGNQYIYCMNNLGHLTKMVAKSIYGKNPSKIFVGTRGPISMKLGM